MTIQWSEASTKRGIIWVATALVGAVFIFLGKPVGQLLLLAGGVAGVLDRIRLTTVNGTDTFDAGSINILYE